ncbi:MAG TPA: hypothetical protein DEP66_05920, partial [Acidimicrobiaceae bacterium]|nr:hypothetical protein [Acidimicrobiaceae bacterium]
MTHEESLTHAEHFDDDGHPDYPATLRVSTPERVGRWRVLVHWLLAIPHFLILGVLQGLVQLIMSIVTWLVVVFTGRLPEGLARFWMMLLRYDTRVNCYALVLATPYPPFDFSSAETDPDDYPVHVDFEPEYDRRNRLTVLFRLILAIPQIIFIVVVAVVWLFVAVFSFFTLLFAGRWLPGPHRFTVGFFAASLRLSAYLAMLTDKHPPFS